MSTYRVAHLNQQGQQMIIVPLESSFGHRTNTEQNEISQALQACATAAGLAGTVVPVWDGGGGRMAFLAPRPWLPFFQSLTLQAVEANINMQITCG